MIEEWVKSDKIWQIILPTILAIVVVARNAIWSVFKWIYTQVKRCIKYLYDKLPVNVEIKNLKAELKTTENTLQQMVGLLNDIAKEFRPNGGFSMKDIVHSMEDRLMKISARQKRTENQLRIGTFEMNENLWIDVNDELLDWVGRDREEMLNKGYVNAIYEDDRDRVSNLFTKAATDIREIDCEFRLQHVDGIFFKVRCVAKPYPSHAKFITYFGTIKRI